MADSSDPDSYDDIGPESGRPPTGAPRWAKAFGIIGLVLVALVVVLLLAGGANHGPGRHSSGGAAGQAPTVSGALQGSGARDHGRPSGGHAPR